jgi:AhpD family alkylhydroperoxidase
MITDTEAAALSPAVAPDPAAPATIRRHGWEPRLDFDAAAPDFARAMAHLERAAGREAEQAGLSPLLLHLVRLRASQINGCAYCIDTHAKDARAAGASDEQIVGVSAWEEVPFFDGPTRAALAFTEAVTLCAEGHVRDPDYEAAARVFSPKPLAALLSVIVTINAWNRLGTATRAWLPGSYQP